MVMAWAYGKLLEVVERILKVDFALELAMREGVNFGRMDGVKTFH